MDGAERVGDSERKEMKRPLKYIVLFLLIIIPFTQNQAQNRQRFDGGMKAVHPAYTDSRRHFPIVHPNFKRDFTFHFAVGMPF